jgi:hypothetical protein
MKMKSLYRRLCVLTSGFYVPQLFPCVLTRGCTVARAPTELFHMVMSPPSTKRPLRLVELLNHFPIIVLINISNRSRDSSVSIVSVFGTARSLYHCRWRSMKTAWRKLMICAWESPVGRLVGINLWSLSLRLYPLSCR